MSARPLTILFMPESAYGPTNQCIGLGDVLRRRGHRVVFAAEASWRGKLDRRSGFEEDLVDLSPPPEPTGDGEPEQDAGAFWKQFIHDTAPEFRKPTVEQLGDLHPADLAGAGRRRALLPAAAHRDPGAHPARRRGRWTTWSASRRC